MEDDTPGENTADWSGVLIITHVLNHPGTGPVLRDCFATTVIDVRAAPSEPSDAGMTTTASGDGMSHTDLYLNMYYKYLPIYLRINKIFMSFSGGAGGVRSTRYCGLIHTSHYGININR